MSRKGLREFMWSFFSVHTLSTKRRKLSACRSGCPPAYAQLVHSFLGISPTGRPGIAYVIVKYFYDHFPLIAESLPPRSPAPRRACRPACSPRAARGVVAANRPQSLPPQCTGNAVARSRASAYHRHMTTWQQTKRDGQLKPLSSLQAALMCTVVTG